MSPFEVDRRDAPKRGVAPTRVVPTLDVAKQRKTRFGLGPQAASVEQLALEAREEALGHGVVVGVSDAAHGGPNAHLAAAVAEGDRGVHTSIRYTERLAQAGIEPSVGSVDDSYDNALAETINGLYKAELVHRRRWPGLTDVELATLEWTNWCNHRRLLEPIGNIPPPDAEEHYYQQHSELPMAA